MKWVISISSRPYDFSRNLLRILDYLESSLMGLRYELLDLEALGSVGAHLSEKTNNDESTLVKFDCLNDLLGHDDTQLIELELNIYKSNMLIYKMVVSDGTFAEVLGSNEKPPLEILGRHIDVNRDYFNW